MTTEQLRSTRDAIPFLPFSLHLADGRSFRVPHRDYLLISPHGRIAFVFRTENEAFNIVDVMLITDLSVDGAAQQEAVAASTA